MARNCDECGGLRLNGASVIADRDPETGETDYYLGSAATQPEKKVLYCCRSCAKTLVGVGGDA